MGNSCSNCCANRGEGNTEIGFPHDEQDRIYLDINKNPNKLALIVRIQASIRAVLARKQVQVIKKSRDRALFSQQKLDIHDPNYNNPGVLQQAQRLGTFDYGPALDDGT